MSVDDPGTREKESKRRSVREDLISGILNEAASAASIEEKYYDRELRKRSEKTEQQKVSAEQARRNAIAQQMAEEKERRRRAKAMRASLAQEIQVEELRKAGKYNPKPSQEAAPDTGEYTHEQIMQAAAHVRGVQHGIGAPTRKGPVPFLVAGGLVVFFGAVALVLGLLVTASPELDPTVYQKNRVSTVDTRPATTVVAIQMIPQPEPEHSAVADSNESDRSSRRSSRRSRRNRSHDSDRGGTAENSAETTSERSSVTDSISLDGDDIFGRRDY